MASLVHWEYKDKEGAIPALQKLILSTLLSIGPSSYHWEFSFHLYILS